MAKHTFVLPEEYRVADVKRACQFDFDRAMAALESRLGSKAYVMGETFTVPDLILGNCLAWATSIKWRLPEGNVSSYFDRIRSRPAFMRALALRSAA